METIRNYLENMFMHIKCTPEVNRAKEELLTMMEDKYEELKAEGKSENEAIGIVISEFGNLEELADELGIEENVQESREKENGIFVSFAQAKKYIADMQAASFKIAIAVMLCICSPIAVILAAGAQKSYHFDDKIVAIGGLVPLFVLVACAVVIFIITGMSISGYDKYKTESILIDYETKQYLLSEKENEKKEMAVKIAIGVFLCIISVIPVVVVGCMNFAYDFPACVTVAILLAIVSIAVFLFITGGAKTECYDILLQEKNYSENRKKASKPMAIFNSIFWPVVTLIYLVWSFTTKNWGFTWIVWPIAGITTGVVGSIVAAVTGKE